MYNFLYSVYYLRFGNGWFDWFYGKSIVRLMNFLFPLYFSFTCTKAKHSIESIHEPEKLRYIVSLTTFPARISKVWLTIETILRQDVKPDAIMLWLFKGEFPDKAKLPKRLLAQEKRGLQIRFCEQNLMPHKKYYYTFKEYPYANVVTVDDDFFFPDKLIRNLKNAHTKYSKAICCTITRQINVQNNTVQPYRSWKMTSINTSPQYNLLIMGGWGTLFPSGCFDSESFNINSIIKYSLTADDLWLKVMSLRNRLRVMCIAGEYPRRFIPVRINKGNKLMDDNIHGGDNDRIFNVLLQTYNIPPSMLRKL
jgi:hypothetical protein